MHHILFSHNSPEITEVKDSKEKVSQDTFCLVSQDTFCNVSQDTFCKVSQDVSRHFTHKRLKASQDTFWNEMIDK